MDFAECDFTVTDEVRALADELEWVFGREIPLVRRRRGEAGRKCAPFLVLHPRAVAILYGRDLDLHSLAHELCHLKRVASGIPVVKAPTDAAQMWVMFHIENPLEHAAIFPVLCAMDLGVDPYSSGLEGTRRRFEREAPGILRSGRRTEIVGAVWTSVALTRDAAFHDAVKSAVAAVDPDALEAGMRVVGAIEEHGLAEPGDKVAVLRELKRALGAPGAMPLRRLRITRPPAETWYRLERAGEVT